jgi:acetolactate synthase-like protein
MMHGGNLVAAVLRRHNVPFLFTLCGGHISPILSACKSSGIRVIDVRHEVNAVFAADAVSRLSGTPGVAAVTAGPGLTNTITAVKNAQLAQSALVLLGGATATVLRGRGSLQDIDQTALFRPHVKWCARVERVRDIPAILTEAFRRARTGVPGPVFVELPVDLLYSRELVREWYLGKTEKAGDLRARFLNWYLKRHLNRLFAGGEQARIPEPAVARHARHSASQIRRVADRLARAKRPVLLIGSQATLDAENIEVLSRAVESLGIPVYLGGMARGLLGRNHRLQMRHKRREALKECDLVILAGLSADFRLDYGRHIKSRSTYVALNRCRKDLYKNKRPDLAIHCDPGEFLKDLAAAAAVSSRAEWLDALRARDRQREEEIVRSADEPTRYNNPVRFCRSVEARLSQDSILVADGGDFVGTAAYIVQPRGPLSWLDPGLFGTLGVGAGFALGAKLARPDAEVWIIYGDGSCGYSIAEFDTFVRHNIPVIAVVGNDACWNQIAREQVEILNDDVGVTLRYTDYHSVARGFGGRGGVVRGPDDVDAILAEAQDSVREGAPYLVNALLGKSEFRKGSLSM